MERKTHEQYLVKVLQRWQADKQQWSNALFWYPASKPGQRFVTSQEEAEKVLDHALRLWNGKKQYNAKGERIETTEIGKSGLGVDLACTKGTDYDMEIINHQILKRTVTEWEEVI